MSQTVCNVGGGCGCVNGRPWQGCACSCHVRLCVECGKSVHKGAHWVTDVHGNHGYWACKVKPRDPDEISSLRAQIAEMKAAEPSKPSQHEPVDCAERDCPQHKELWDAWAKISTNGLTAKPSPDEQMADEVHNIAEFLVGNGDVADLAARRLRKALDRYEKEKAEGLK